MTLCKPPTFMTVNPKLIGVAILIFAIIIALAQLTYVVNPGERGVQVTLGKVLPQFEPEGLGFKTPFITHIHPVSVRQQTKGMKAECYSMDLQQLNMDVKVLY